MIKADYERGLEKSLKQMRKLGTNYQIPVFCEIERLLVDEIVRIQGIADRHVMIGDKIDQAEIVFPKGEGSTTTGTPQSGKPVVPANQVLTKVSAKQKLKSYTDQERTAIKSENNNRKYREILRKLED